MRTKIVVSQPKMRSRLKSRYAFGAFLMVTITILLTPLSFAGLSASQVYTSKFEKAANQAEPLLESLVADAIQAFGDKTPARRVVGKLDIPGDLKEAFIQDQEGDLKTFLSSARGRAWNAKRNNLRKTLPATLDKRLQVLRTAANRIRALNPVPRSLAATDKLVSQYGSGIYYVSELVKFGIKGDQSRLDEADAELENLRDLRAAIESRLSTATHSATKKYISG